MRPIPYSDPLAPLLIRNELFSLLPAHTRHLTVVCIGSNRINGDSLGPFVGTLLENVYPDHLTVIGTLQEPVDATNLRFVHERLNERGSYVLAIDSIVGPRPFVHTIAIRPGALAPGTALGKSLPRIGDVSIMGVMMEETADMSTLPYTNLHIVYQMAKVIALGLSLTVRQRYGYESSAPLLA
ncbi:spore protease YyaC [Geobacillus sp. 46C-IIa]|uniref:spore protease YyaC n=1 Tax=Geobacillus sp. 46C-IIa TaxID=1963025 RepID=UPI0009BD8DEA|nr:spore protease YyaC [Geobacillus sp. 46C-IIa]OQP07800.1 spore protease YyaC [Geobacillus sp. 46C-IIa]QNU27038.1 spore protease YyaC [Geobacillus sp. 46C-IIa]